VSFGFFVRNIETKTGPQRFKLSLAQSLPWPSKLTAVRAAARERAYAAGLQVDAIVLAIRKRVADAYWSLWLIDEEDRLMSEHDAVLEALSGAVRGRMEVGAASLADLNQVNLSVARHSDHVGKHRDVRRKAVARLRAAVGAAAGDARLTVADAPAGGLPAVADDELLQKARMHPAIVAHDHLAQSEDAAARAESYDRYPSLKLGMDWINIGEADPSTVPESGKDAFVVMAGMSLPLWAGSYSDAEQAAHAAAAAQRAEREARERRSEAALEAALSEIRDAQRRIHLYRDTLVPQAETTLEATMGGYQTGRSTLAATILAQRDLIDLKIALAQARADHARAWAALELVVGAPVDRTEESHD
jgi:outer membrane protein TolC